MDRITVEQRSETMRRIRGKDTSPELLVRRIVFRLGFRYRLHVADLPGKPDLVFKAKRKAIFVNGCFWHFHKRCRTAHFPKSRLEYWIPKLEGNKRRDRLNMKRLRRLGWQVLVVWECETSDPHSLSLRLERFLGNDK
jgi:DNA mismatch endonuclease (patch repair protein)